MKNDHIVDFDFQHVSPFEVRARVHVSPDFVQKVYRTAVDCCAAEVQPPGIPAGVGSPTYAAKHYHGSIITYLRNFLISFCAETFLREKLRDKRFVIAGLPRCRTADIELNKQAALFEFDVTVIPIAVNSQWKHAPFRPPTRKNYRDLDNQVTTFLQEEQGLAQCATEEIGDNDWIGFLATPLSGTTSLCAPSFLWLHIGSDEMDLEARTIFLAKRQGMRFNSRASFLHEYFRAFHDKQYNFDLTIQHHMPSKSFDIDIFRQYFRLKSDKDVHRKMVEIFSFRHDISLRRETAEAALRLVLRYHPFPVPFLFVQKEAEVLLEHICSNPDYYVYKSCPDFREKIQLLAQKRVREAAMMDALAWDIGMTVSPEDILGYINLLKRSRTKEFVYFMLPETRIQEREAPLSHDTMAQICLREKTLNHVIQLLLRNAS
jgi:FKBP-type peptidyl-prolyl cis-trans isomerase (trigger factor)